MGIGAGSKSAGEDLRVWDPRWCHHFHGRAVGGSTNKARQTTHREQNSQNISIIN